MSAPDLEKAIETMTDARDVCEHGGSAYFYRHNGGMERMENVIACLKAAEEQAAELERVKGELERAAADFKDYVQTNLPNPAPFCKNWRPGCTDRVGWCKLGPGVCGRFEYGKSPMIAEEAEE